MPGAWELRQQSSVLCAVLHVDTTSIAWAIGLRNLIIPGPVMPLAGMPYDMARNVACMRTLESGAEWLFFLDSDVIPPRDAVPRLMAHKKPIVSGIYCRRSPPCSVPVMIKDGSWMTSFPPQGLFEVDLVGAGCLLIHRTVLEQLPPLDPGHHWFSWRVDMKGTPGMVDGECLSEDFSFCVHARRHGFPVLVDPTIQCKHIGFAQATFGQFAPLDVVAV